MTTLPTPIPASRGGFIVTSVTEPLEGLDELDSLALLNVGLGTDGGPTPTSLDQMYVGQIIRLHGHGHRRTGVVTKIGKKNVSAVFTTPSAVKEAQEHSQRCRMTVEPQLGVRLLDAKRHLDYLERKSRGQSEQFEWETDEGYVKRMERYLEEGKRQLAEFLAEGTVEEHAQRAFERDHDRWDRDRKAPWTVFINFTRPAQVKLADIRLCLAVVVPDEETTS
jgi:hypothetical protein